MNKYLALLRYETKTIVRTPINLFMCLFPVVILLLAAFVFPLIFRSMNPADEAALRIAMLLMLVIILAIGSYFLAAMATFLLLEHKDENSLKTIAVTPLGASGYLRFKMAYVYVMAFLGMLLILIGTKYIAGHHYAIGPFPYLKTCPSPRSSLSAPSARCWFPRSPFSRAPLPRTRSKASRSSRGPALSRWCPC